MSDDPAPPSAPPLGPLHAARAGVLGCMSLIFAGLIAAALGAGLALGLGWDEEAAKLAVALPLQSALMILVAWFITQGSREGPARALALGRPRYLWLAPSILLVGPSSDLIVTSLRALVPALELGSIGTLEAAAQQPGALGAAVLLGAVFAAPLSEELLFRGAIFGGLRARFGPGLSVALSALAFGAWHVDPLHAAGAAALGLWLGWMREISGSVWPCVLAHTLNNGLWALLSRMGDPPDLPLWGVVGGLALATAVALGLQRREGEASQSGM